MTQPHRPGRVRSTREREGTQRPPKVAEESTFPAKEGMPPKVVAYDAIEEEEAAADDDESA